VYFAPNTSFDFTLIGFQQLDPAQAEAAWLKEYNNIVSQGTTPIIHFPWHDYGLTNWPSEPGVDPGYTLAMFTNFIERAYNQGTEFVTGADLAQRIESFVATRVEITQVGSEIVAQVTGSDVGKFALDVDTNEVIASVEDWYAFDGKKVFLPQNGGTFEITLGGQAADVTRVAALPMRAELLTVNGDGSDLSFSLVGKGDAVVDLQAWGNRAVLVTGADGMSLSGERVTLSFASLGTHLAPHTVGIDFQSVGSAGQQVTGTSGNDLLIGSALGMRVDGGQGSDVLFGGGGSDVFIFRAGSGSDTVLDFTSGVDKIELVNSGFADTGAALTAFVAQANDLVLTLAGSDKLVLANVALGHLALDDLMLTDNLLV
jgi:serralysin